MYTHARGFRGRPSWEDTPKRSAEGQRKKRKTRRKKGPGELGSRGSAKVSTPLVNKGRAKLIKAMKTLVPVRRSFDDDPEKAARAKKIEARLNSRMRGVVVVRIEGKGK